MTLLAQCREALEIHANCDRGIDEVLELLTPEALKADEEMREWEKKHSELLGLLQSERDRFGKLETELMKKAEGLVKALERIRVMESSIPKLDKNNYAHGAKIADEALSQKP